MSSETGVRRMSPVNSQEVFLASIPEVPSNTCKCSRKNKNKPQDRSFVLHKVTPECCFTCSPQGTKQELLWKGLQELKTPQNPALTKIIKSISNNHQTWSNSFDLKCFPPAKFSRCNNVEKKQLFGRNTSSHSAQGWSGIQHCKFQGIP